MHTTRKQRTIGRTRDRGRVRLLERARRVAGVPAGGCRRGDRVRPPRSAGCPQDPGADRPPRGDAPPARASAAARPAWRWSSTSWPRWRAWQIDNCEVWVDEAEMPGCDGSALPFVVALDGAGIVGAGRRPAAPRSSASAIRLGDDGKLDRGPAGHSTVPVFRYQLDYGLDSPIGRQTFEIALTPESFRREMAPCRTFMLKAEADRLQAQGLGLRTTARDLLVFGDDGPIDNRPAFPRRVRASQALGHGRRPGAGRVRLGRAVYGIPQRAPAECRAGADAVGPDGNRTAVAAKRLENDE